VKIYEARLTYNIISEGASEALDSPEKVARFMADAVGVDPCVECFHIIALNRKNHPLGRILVTKGTATASLVHPREVFKPAILAGASAIICLHNHPSGDPSPSQADIRATRQLREAAKVLQIDLLDHVVLGNKVDDPMGQGYYSFAEAGLL
jgi:DNA repair protein RadC